MSTIGTKNNKVLWNDGEAVGHGDLNDMQQYQRAFMVDGLLGCQARTTINDLFPSDAYCWSPNSMQACAKTTGVARQITNAEGWIGQWTSAGQSDGLTPRLLWYRLAAGELLSTVVIGGANNRWSGVFVKLSEVDDDLQGRDFEDSSTRKISSSLLNKKRRVQLDFQVVDGAEAANPSHPAAPAGYVPWAFVYVPSAFNAVLTYDHISDERIPMRFGSVTVMANGMALQAAGYALNAARTHMRSSGVNGEEVIALFPGPMDARILRVTVEVQTAAALTSCQVKRYAMRNIPIVQQVPGQRLVSSFLPSSSVQSQLLLSPPSGAGQAGALWGTGHPAGPGHIITDGDSGAQNSAIQYRAGLLMSDDGSGQVDWTMVRFDYAH